MTASILAARFAGEPRRSTHKDGSGTQRRSEIGAASHRGTARVARSGQEGSLRRAWGSERGSVLAREGWIAASNGSHHGRGAEVVAAKRPRVAAMNVVWNKGFDQMVGHAPDESRCPPTGQSQR